MNEIMLFAGTTEGRQLAERLVHAGRKVHICVATEYGEEMLFKHENLVVHQGRLDCDGMIRLLKEKTWDMVIDATHPYAIEVSENIKNACVCTQNTYRRLFRKEDECVKLSFVHYVDTIEDAIVYLNERQGNILLTTGSKDLPVYISGIDDLSRIYARILADAPTIERCKKYGMFGKQIICMQGPFSAELNAAMLRQINGRYLVTKDTGNVGGFPEKIEGAKNAKAEVIVIRRPREETGYSINELLKELDIKTEKEKQTVTLLGIGMGQLSDLTLEGKTACETADVILGASRMIESLSRFGKESNAIYAPKDIANYIKSHPEKRNIVIALSGDVGFYSGAKKIWAVLEHLEVNRKMIPGISSVVYFASRLHISWEDIKLVSVHGRTQNLIHAVKSNEKVFSLAGYAESVRCIAQSFFDNGLTDVNMYVGCQLSYPEENIQCGKPEDFLQYRQEGLCVVYIENPNAKNYVVTHGISDECFERGSAPMTKEEVRTISLSKLALTKDSVIYDVGAGTGSIGLECAIQAYDGHVYAIEKKKDAADILYRNQKKFAVTNFDVIIGEAPETLEKLPTPTHAFIGGSCGQMQSIIEILLEKNPQIRIVINCIAMETVAEVMELVKENRFDYTDIVQVSVNKSRTMGGYHMMMGQNPVYIVTLQRGRTNEYS